MGGHKPGFSSEILGFSPRIRKKPGFFEGSA